MGVDTMYSLPLSTARCVPNASKSDSTEVCTVSNLVIGVTPSSCVSAVARVAVQKGHLRKLWCSAFERAPAGRLSGLHNCSAVDRYTVALSWPRNRSASRIGNALSEGGRQVRTRTSPRFDSRTSRRAAESAAERVSQLPAAVHRE